MFGTFDWFYTSAEGEFNDITQVYLGIYGLYLAIYWSYTLAKEEFKHNTQVYRGSPLYQNTVVI